MNAAIKTGLLAAGALIAYNAFAKAGALTRLNFYPKGVSGLRFDGVTPVVTLSLAIQNTSNQAIVLRSIAGNVYANGTLVGNVSNYVPTRIRENSETFLPLTVRLSLLGITENIIAAIQGNAGFSQRMELDARANLDNYNLPVNVKYTIGG